MNPNGKPGNVLSIVLQSSSLAIFACRTVPSNTYSISPCTIRTGCDTEVDILAEAACCAGTVVFAADDDEHETVEASAWTNVVLAADENGDGPNETTDLGTK